MGNIKLVFCDADTSAELQAFINHDNKLYLEIDMCDYVAGNFYPPSYVCLDLETAKELLNHLEKQINTLNPELFIKFSNNNLKFK